MATPNFFQQAKQAMELRSQVKKIQKQLESQTVDFENAGVKVTGATEAAIQAGASEEDIENLDVDATLAEAEAKSKAKPKPAAKTKATAKKDESKES